MKRDFLDDVPPSFRIGAANDDAPQFFERNTRLPPYAFRDTERTFAQWLKHKARIVWALVRR